jgi:glycosyltransferase involved in cell wall biosynthesis
VYAAKLAEAWRQQGHDVVLVCQQPPTDRLDFVDRWMKRSGSVEAEVVSTRGGAGGGRVTVVRPDIGPLLPVFVLDEYEGFEVKRFVDLTDGELDTYLDRNVAALSDAAGRLEPEAVVAGHLIPGPVVARRALGDGTFVAKVHGSDLEYAVRVQDRYAALAREGVDGARAVVGASRDVLRRTVEVAPSIADRTRVVPPGVDVDRWRPRLRVEALEEAARLLDRDPDTARGRPARTDGASTAALARDDLAALDALARTYDQTVPDPDAAGRLRSLAAWRGPILGYFGKLIPEKGVERVLEAAALLGPDVRLVVVGFGLGRELLTALVAALDRGDVDGYARLREESRLDLELDTDEVRSARGFADRVTFTGRLDHRYAPEVVATLDVLAVPSTLEEAFGMVAAEGAAAGALPLVARHSSLAEVAEALERAIGRPGTLSFEPGPGATRRLAEALRRLLDLPPDERRRLAGAVRGHVAAEWTWERTAERLLEAAGR